MSMARRWFLSRVAARVARSYLAWVSQGVGGDGLPAGDRGGAGHGQGGGVPTSLCQADSLVSCYIAAAGDATPAQALQSKAEPCSGRSGAAMVQHGPAAKYAPCCDGDSSHIWSQLENPIWLPQPLPCCSSHLHPGKCCTDHIPHASCPTRVSPPAQSSCGLILHPRAEVLVGSHRLDPLARSLCPSCAEQMKTPARVRGESKPSNWL